MKKKEQLHTSTNVNDLNIVNNQSGTNNDEITKLIEREQVEDTPFWIVGNKEKGYCLTLGKWKVSEYMETIEEILTWMERENWKLILTLIGVVVEDMIKDDSIEHYQLLRKKYNDI